MPEIYINPLLRPSKRKMHIIDQHKFDAIPRNGLIGEWLFSGNADDTSGNGNDGIVNGATLTTDRYSNPNSAYNFIKGQDDYIDISSVGHLPVISVSLWVKWTSGNNMGVISKRNNGHGDYSLILAADSIGAGLRVNTLTYWLPSNINIRDGAWHHIVYIIGLSQIKLFVDLISTSISFTPPLTNNGSKIYIGQYFSSAFSMNGDIDDTRIYNRELTQDEITALFNE